METQEKKGWEGGSGPGESHSSVSRPDLQTRHFVTPSGSNFSLRYSAAIDYSDRPSKEGQVSHVVQIMIMIMRPWLYEDHTLS